MGSNGYFFPNTAKVYPDAKSYSLIQYREFNGVSIPRFCYHSNLSIAGNCRMCLVEIHESTKPVIARATEVSNNPRVLTTPNFVRTARENILELLPLNHPLDCPICDQGGECDLQDQTIIYGSDKGRFKAPKRVVEPKYFGPFIKTVMTRCIHCTRCIRYPKEVAGVSLLGTIGRGVHTEIDTYIDTYINTEVSGNVIDTCPVGALTTKPSAYRARSWEFYSFETIDILDSVCSSIRIDLRGNEIYRILPRNNSTHNSNWITDRVRFSYDSYKQQRFILPLFRTKNRLLSKCSWEAIYRYIKLVFTHHCSTPEQLATCFSISGIYIDTYSQLLSKYLAWHLGISTINPRYSCPSNLRNTYILNKPITELEHSTFYFVFGMDLAKESPLLNIRIQKSMYTNPSAVTYYVGTTLHFNYAAKQLGFATSTFISFFHGQSSICHTFLHSICPTFLLGSDTFPYSPIGFHSVSYIGQHLSVRTSYNYISLFASDVSIHELGLVSTINTRSLSTVEAFPTLVYLLGTAKRSHATHPLLSYDVSCRPFTIYQGSHMDEDIELYNITLPNCTYLETPSKRFYLNCEGLAKLSNQVHTVSKAQHAPDIILYTLPKYLSNSHILTRVDTEYLKHLHTIHVPLTAHFRSNRNSSVLCTSVCPWRNTSHFIHATIHITQLRSYYGAELMSRISSAISKYTTLQRRPSNFH